MNATPLGVGDRYWRLNPHVLESLDDLARATQLGRLSLDAKRTLGRARTFYVRQLSEGRTPQQLRAVTGLYTRTLNTYSTPAQPPTAPLDPYLTIDWTGLDQHRKVPAEYIRLLGLTARAAQTGIATYYRNWIGTMAEETSKGEVCRRTGLSPSRVNFIVNRHAFETGRP